MKYKKLLLVLAIMVGLAGFTGIMNVHADPSWPGEHSDDTYAGAYTNSEINWDNAEAQADAQEAQLANENNDKYGTPDPTYDQIIDSQERPLSEQFPNGHWNGISDVKGDNTNYKTLKEKLEDAKNKLENAKDEVVIRADRSEIRELDKIINKNNAEQRKANRRTNQWYAKHTYIGRSRVYYVKYKGFSRRQYRYAFASYDEAQNNLGLSRSYKAVIHAMGNKNGNYKYHADTTVKSGQLVMMKYLGDNNEYDQDVYRAKFNHKYYYYAPTYDKYGSSISPYTAEYNSKYKTYYSMVQPWKSRIIILPKNTKLHNGSNWSYTYSNGMNEADYKLKGHTWHNTALGDDAPDWLN